MDKVETDILELFARALRQAQNLVTFVDLVIRAVAVVMEDSPRSCLGCGGRRKR